MSKKHLLSCLRLSVLSRVDSVSLVSRQSVLGLLLVFLTTIFGVGNAWGETATMAGGSSVTVSGKNAVKVGASKSGGSMTITVGAGATSLSFYIAAWSGDNTSVSVSPAEKVNPTSLNPTQDNGISGTGSTYTLNGTESSYFTTVTLSKITQETEITLSCSSVKNRFVVWGATYEVAPKNPGVYLEPNFRS